MPKRNTLERADVAAAHATRPLRGTPAVGVLGRLSELADQPPLTTICALTFVCGLLGGNARLAHAGARMLAAELLGTKLKSAVKHRIDRTRPEAVESGTAYRAGAGQDRASAMNSFPSGHSVGAVAVARAYAREYPEHRIAAYGAAATAAAVQVPRGKHYPADIVAGAAVGMLAEGAVHLIARIMRRSRSSRGRAVSMPRPSAVA